MNTDHSASMIRNYQQRSNFVSIRVTTTLTMLKATFGGSTDPATLSSMDFMFLRATWNKHRKKKSNRERSNGKQTEKEHHIFVSPPPWYQI